MLWQQCLLTLVNRHEPFQCCGEPGVGYGKMKYLELEHGEGLVVMRAITHALDPDDRMNPGKVVA